MSASPTLSGSVGISRREVIRRAALAAGVVLSPAWLPSIDRAGVSAQATALTATHLALAGAVADRILPRTDTPGASDVGVPAFINLLYREFMSEAERMTLTEGLDRVDAASRGAHGAGFATATTDQQDAVLRTIARAEQAQPQGFFRLIRSATILGYFTSEQVGRNVLHYDPVPGRYDACVPLSEVGNRNWTT
ncbi:MAG: gluconate 2-dehydrogenase subunit 3 family protein [Acidobacteria bacterium]|nr:gluconate 2-dehydrogenase subunit 3 family protein [Acidobacteriota bacterium]